MPIASQLMISNLAISHVKAKAIASLNENSLEATECSRHYPRTIGSLLEGEHDWSFAIRRGTLAALAINDRENEWLYAYALPANLGNPIRVIPDLSAAGIALPVPLPGDPYAEAWTTAGLYIETPYIIDGTTLYSNVENATLEYTINDISGLNISELVVKWAALDLAARICVPVKGKEDREKNLADAAEVALQRAIADDRNRQPQVQGQYISEPIAARRGYLSEMP